MIISTFNQTDSQYDNKNDNNNESSNSNKQKAELKTKKKWKKHGTIFNYNLIDGDDDDDYKQLRALKR